ncbi:flavodoxin family protein [Patescibacteria group bacterium]|nr:flavodoxin family protein [Patescibacteria group bacterium]
MKLLVIFDSMYGNTKIIAETVAKELGKEAKVKQAEEIGNKDWEGVRAVVVGSPINGWKPSVKMEAFLNGLKQGQLNGMKAAAFDTRINFIFHGDAAKKIEKKLRAAGAEIVAAPGNFFVKGTEGPLAEGEIDKAKVWTKSFKAKI